MNIIPGNTMNINISMIILLFLSAFFPPIASGIGAREHYHIKHTQISSEVLKDTIGIITIVSRTKEPVYLRTYNYSGENFTESRKIHIFKNTVPLSHFGHPRRDKSLFVENYRYPVVETNKDYLYIVTNPIKNTRAWVNIKNIKSDYYVSLMMFDDITIPNSFFIDVFCFISSPGRKVYTEPALNSDTFIIFGRQSKYSALAVIDQRNGFLKIASVIPGKSESEPLGWVRIRDDSGMLTLWIKFVDFD